MVNHVTSSNTIIPVMMTNSISLEEQTTQMVKQIEVLTKTINKNNAQIALLTSNVKSMEESNQLVVDPSTIFPLKKKNPSHGTKSSKAQEPPL